MSIYFIELIVPSVVKGEGVEDKAHSSSLVMASGKTPVLFFQSMLGL